MSRTLRKQGGLPSRSSGQQGRQGDHRYAFTNQQWRFKDRALHPRGDAGLLLLNNIHPTRALSADGGNQSGEWAPLRMGKGSDSTRGAMRYGQLARELFRILDALLRHVTDIISGAKVQAFENSIYMQMYPQSSRTDAFPQALLLALHATE